MGVRAGGHLDWVTGLGAQGSSVCCDPGAMILHRATSSTAGLPCTGARAGTGHGPECGQVGHSPTVSTMLCRPVWGEKEQFMGNLLGRVTWLNQTALTVPCSL